MAKKIDGKGRAVWLAGEIDEEKTAKVIKEILEFNGESREEIELFIHSVGGSMPGGHAIVDIMQAVTAPIKTIALGMVRSSALSVMVSGNIRLATLRTSFLIHPAYSRNGGHSVLDGQDDLNNLKREEVLKYSILRSRTNIPNKVLSSSKRDMVYFNAEEALEWGVIDEIIQPGSIGGAYIEGSVYGEG